MLGVSERRACRVLGQHRSTQRHVPRGRADEERLVEDMIELARLMAVMAIDVLQHCCSDAGWSVSDGRMERLWKIARGVEGTTQTTKAGPPVAQRWLVCSLACWACKPRLVLRLRASPHG